MNQFSLNKFISGTLIILVILSFFFGFYLDESSFGAGGYNGDFEHVYTCAKPVNKKKHPPLPFTTSALQQKASNILGLFKYILWKEPLLFNFIFFAITASNPLVFLSTIPPAAVVKTCNPQQLPKIKFFFVSNNFANSICLLIGGV